MDYAESPRTTKHKNPFKDYKEKKEPKRLKAKTPLKPSRTTVKAKKKENETPVPKTKDKPLKTKAKKKKTAKWYRDKCDILFSKKIRSIGRCEWCGTRDNLQCSHIISRTVMALRCDERNAISLCYGCHLHKWHKEPLMAAEWFNSKFPGRYDTLILLKNETLGKKVDWESKYNELLQNFT